jgi:hypothetical protein
MGILDEAIREHLELKRRSGADPSEVERQEQEALGPVRRIPHDTADAVLDEPSPAAGAYPEDVPYLEDDEISEWTDAPEDAMPFDQASGAAAPPSESWSEPPTQIARPPADYEPEPPRERTPDTPRHHEIAEEWEAHEQQGFVGEPAGFEPDEPAPGPPPPEPDPGYAPPPQPASGGPLFRDDRQGPPGPDPAGIDQATEEYLVEEEEGGPGEPAEPGSDEDVLEETPDFLQDTPDHDRLWFEQRPPRDFDFDG